MEQPRARDLLVLPFDHRGTFAKKMPGLKDLPAEEQARKIKEFKKIIYDAYKAVVQEGLSLQESAILVDEQYGSEILVEAKANGATIALTVEKSGQEEFDFEYGEQFAEHIEKFRPHYAKVLVRLNPEGEKEANKRQLERLKRLGDYCKSNGCKYLFELLVEPTKEQLESAGGSKRKFDQEQRGKLMVSAIKMIQKAGVSPDVWKLEGLEKREEMEAVAKQVRSGGNNAGIVVLGRGETEEKVKDWLRAAAKVEGVIGFAVGRTVFWDALEQFNAGKLPREQAVQEIAKNYKSFVELWKQAKNSQ